MQPDGIMMVAKVILRDGTGRILVLRRSGTHPTHAYHLDFPGGEVEPGETPLEAVWREMQEEAGLTVGQDAFELVHEVQYKPQLKYLVYAAQVPHVNPDVQISWEHDQFEWLHPHELLARPMPENVDSYYRVAMDHLAAAHGKSNRQS